MYIVLVYDITGTKVTKMLKLCRRYLHWVQNSVFEGEITEKSLEKLQKEAKKIMDREKDSLIIFECRQESWIERKVIGKDKNRTGNIL